MRDIITKWWSLSLAGHKLRISPDVVKSLQLIWRSFRLNLWVPNLQMSYRDLITWQNTRIVALSMAAGWHTLLTHWPIEIRKFQRNFRKVIFQLILVIDGWSIACKIVLKWIPMDLTDAKSTLVQVMAWCHQATSHYLSQFWSRSLLPFGAIRPQWVNSSPPRRNGRHFADNLFRCIFMNEKFCILIKIPLKFVPKGLINNNPTLV